MRVQASPNNLATEVIAAMQSGDYAVYRYVDFDTNIKSIQLRASLQNDLDGGVVYVHLDSANGPLISQIHLNSITLPNTYETYSREISETAGKHALYLKYSSENGNSVSIDWFSFDTH